MTVLTSSIDANLVDAALRAVLDDVDDLDGGNTSESGSFTASAGGQSISGTFLAAGRPIGSTDGGPVELLVFQILAGGQEFTLTDFSINSNLFVSAVEDDGFDGLLPLLFSGDDQIAGGPLGDSLQGGTGDDLIVAQGGDDTLIGGAGADTLNGGGGADSLLGGGAGDTLLGGGGTDTARGGAGDDSLNGGGGQDALFGGGGADSLIGGGASDSLVGGGGDDLLNGAAGADSLTGGGGADSLIGGGGADTLLGSGGGDALSGGGGADMLLGGAGADSLTGGGGADTLIGGVAADTLTGGGGADVFLFVDGDGADQINGFVQSVDQADLSGVSAFTSFEDLSGSLVDTADGALLSYAGGSALFLGVSADALTAESFIF